MKTIALLLAATISLTACATPDELRAGGKHFVTRTTLSPDAAARCLLKNFEASSSALRGRVMPAGEGRYELLVWTTNDFVVRTTNDSRVLAELAPGDLGITQIDAWVARDALPIDIEVSGHDLLQGWLKGC